jgi:hypothetical protein
MVITVRVSCRLMESPALLVNWKRVRTRLLMEHSILEQEVKRYEASGKR